MKIKVSEMEGSALDWAVAAAIGRDTYHSGWAPSTDWSQGGPLIEEHGVTIEHAMAGRGEWNAYKRNDEDHPGFYAATPLIAAMRAIVAAELGKEVDVPEGLCD